MKNIFLKSNLLLTFFSIILFTSCDSILDQDEVDFGNGPILATFQNTTDELNIIKDPAVTSIDYQIPITYFGGKNVPLDRDVTVTIGTSSDSQAEEGVEFELVNNEFIIPAGETTANASVRILTENLVPFDFKDIVLEILSSSEAVSNTNTINLTLKALDQNTLAGSYEAVEGLFYNAGGGPFSFAGNTFKISAIEPGLYKHEGFAFWADNEFFFTVDETTGVITVLDEDLEGEPVEINGSPIMTCGGSNSFVSLTCDNTTTKFTLMPDGKHVVEITAGYFRASGTREGYSKLVRK